ncbi:MAG TPA: MFS transporter [Candidatus Binataceae bacterium]|nr:MFS transporter [Candidatus Binataceae bacterium]
MATSEPLKQASEPPGATGHAPRAVLFLTVFIDLLGFGIVIPFLPMFARRLGVGAPGVGLILSTYSLAQLIFAPILGSISDRAGRRPIIMLGLFGSSIGYLTYGFANSFLALIASRAIHGVCAATVPTAQAYIADTTQDAERARGMGLIGAAFGLGFVLGPALGGVLGHSSLRAPGFFASALTFGNLIFAALWLPESHRPDRSSRIDVAGAVARLVALPRAMAAHRLARLFAIAFLLTFALAALEATFALMVPLVYGYGPAGIGGLLAFAGLGQALAQGYLVGKVVPRTGEVVLSRIGLVALAAGMLPLGSLESHAALWIFLGLLSLGYGLASPSVASLISRSTGRDQQGEVMGVNQSALSLARIFGPVAGGLVYQWFGPAAPYFGGAVVALAGLLLTHGIEARSTQAIRGD